MNWFIEPFKKYAVFSGRARRKEYWMFALFCWIMMFLTALIDQVVSSNGIITALFLLAALLPSIAVTVRRLHDTSRSGWWILIFFVPIIGIVLLIFMLLDSTPGQNEYGENPKEASA